MRIVMLVTTSYTNDSRVRRTAEGLAHEGHEVHILCTRDPKNLAKTETLRGPVYVHRLCLRTQDFPAAITHRFRRKARTTGNSQSNVKLKRILSPKIDTTLLRAIATPVLLLGRLRLSRKMLVAARSLRPGCVHANDPDTLAAAGAACSAGVPLVYDSHEFASGRADIFRWERRLDERAEERWIRRANCVITVSPGIASALRARYGIEPVVVRNIPRIEPHREPLFSLRETTGIPVSATVILHQGQVSPNRGLTQLVESMAHLHNHHLVFLGGAVRGTDTRLRSEARRLGVGERIHFVPPVPPEELLPITAQADIGVVLTENIGLSYRYALPNKLFEYLSAGVPVVASDQPEMRSAIEECRGGTFCDPGDPHSIARAIRSSHQTPDTTRVPKFADDFAQLLRCYEGFSTSQSN